MDAHDLVKFLGKTDDSPEIVKLLADFGVKKKLRVEPDMRDLPVTLKPAGLSLVFERVETKSSRLKLVEAQIYSDAEKGFTTFPGQLPSGLTFADSRAEAIKKLGKPYDTQKDFRLDTWISKTSSLTVKFAKGNGSIQMLHLGLPPDE